MVNPERLGLPLPHERVAPTAAQLLRSTEAARLAPLVEDATRLHLASLADQFPMPVLTACCECRLGSDDAQVDLSLCLLPAADGRSRAVLDACSEQAWLPSLRFLRGWSAFENDLTGAIPFVWVAFDLERTAARLPIPCLGLCVDPSFLPSRLGLSIPNADPVVNPIALAEQTHRFLWDRALPAQTRHLLTRALCGDGAHVIAKHFSYMSSRAPATFKLDVRLPAAALEPFLERIGWPSPPSRIAATLRELAPSEAELQLNLVFEPELRQPLEVELLTDPRQTTETARRALLMRLVDLGLCSAEKAEVLQRARERRPHDVIGTSWYVKVRLLDHEPQSAKAYVGLTPRRPWG